MPTISEVHPYVRDSDVILMATVEAVNAAGQGATAYAVASQIKGAPAGGVQDFLGRLALLGVLDQRDGAYYVNSLGAAVLELDFPGWQPSRREQERRDRELAEASRVRVG